MHGSELIQLLQDIEAFAGTMPPREVQTMIRAAEDLSADLEERFAAALEENMRLREQLEIWKLISGPGEGQGASVEGSDPVDTENGAFWAARKKSAVMVH